MAVAYTHMVCRLVHRRLGQDRQRHVDWRILMRHLVFSNAVRIRAEGKRAGAPARSPLEPEGAGDD